MSDSALAPGFIRDLEEAEAMALADMGRAAGSDLAEALGVAVQQVPGRVALRAASADVLALNRILVTDLDSALHDSALEYAIAWYRDAGVRRFFVQLGPVAGAGDLRQRLEAYGLTHYNNWTRLYRGVEAYPDVQTDLRIEQIGTEQATLFAEVATTAFGMPEAVRPWLAAAVGRSGWGHYLALDADTPVAAAALHVQGKIGWMGFASTNASHRRRGAQSALIGRRIADARAQGCRWLSVETAEDLPERPAPSLHNLRRFGFQVAYTRPNYLWASPALAA